MWTVQNRHRDKKKGLGVAGVASTSEYKFFRGWWNILKLQNGDGCPTLWSILKTTESYIHCERETFMVCELYLSKKEGCC